MCLSSLLFSLLINDLPNCIKYSKVTLFADDTSLIISGYIHELANTINMLQYDLSSLYAWVDTNNVELIILTKQ